MLPKLQRTSRSAVDPHGSATTSLVLWVTLCRRCEETMRSISATCRVRFGPRIYACIGEEIVGYLRPHLKSDGLVNTGFLAVARQESLDMPTIDWG